MKRIIGIIGIIGENASGKTTATNYLQNRYGAVSFRFSDMLSNILDRVYVEKTRGNLQALSTFLRQTYSENIMSKTLLKDIEKTDAPLVVIEGIRRPSDITEMKELVLVAIDTDSRNRFERLHGRGEKPDDATKTWEEFQKESGHESEQKIKKLMHQSIYTINNNGTTDELYGQIDGMMTRICG